MDMRFIRLALLPILFIVFASATLACAGTPVDQAVIASIYLCFGVLPITAFLSLGRVLRDAPLFIGMVAVGFVLAGCVSTLAKVLGLPPEPIVWSYLAIGAVGTVVRVYLTHHANGGNPADNGRGATSTRALSLAAFVLILILIAVRLVYGVRMGSGAYPTVFYGVDNAYLLSIVRGLVSDNLFPPRSLTFVGQLGAYHYGTLESAAILTRISGLLPHTSLFLVGSSVLALGGIAFCWLIARTIADGWLRLGVLVILYVSTFNQFYWKPAKRVGKALLMLMRGNDDRQLPLSLEFEHVVSQGGMVLVLCFAYLVMAYAPGRRSIAITLLASILVAASVVVKVTFFIPLCLWIGGMAAIGFVQERPWQGPMRNGLGLAVKHAWPVLFAFLLGLAAMRTLNFAGSDRVLVLAPFADEYVNSNLVEILTYGLFFFIPVITALLLTKGRWRADNRIWIAGAFALLPLVLVALTALTKSGGNETDFNWFQITTPAGLGIGICASLILAGTWPLLGKKLSWVVVAAIVAAMGTQTLRFPLMAIDTALHLDHGAEVLDNRSLIPALQAIPLEATVLVTNDLRSPAENYKRPDRQTQLPGIFGHQGFLITPAYDQTLPDLAEKKAAQELLQLPEWEPAITDAARRYGWTHFLVHKNAPFPRDIPIEKLYESENYDVYRFPQ
nr:hypothetical protein [uncultured Dongia sp.]